MALERTVLIVGAGANKEINHEIGLGKDLITDISNRVTDRNSDKPYLSALLDKIVGVNYSIRYNFSKSLDEYIKASNNSHIDGFIREIEEYPEFEFAKNEFLTIAKVMIVAHVLGYEGTTTQNNIKNDIIEKKTWLSVLGDYLEKEILNKREIEPLTIITFNYDRILEKYLLDRFSNSELIKRFIDAHIFHVYGRLGGIEGACKQTEAEIEFGLKNDQIERVEEIKENIKFMHHHVGDKYIAHRVSNAQKILAFGYGFDDMNNRTISLDKLNDWNEHKIYKNEKLVCKFLINVYPNIDSDFSYRRVMYEKMKRMILNSNIEYFSCFDFLKKHLT